MNPSFYDELAPFYHLLYGDWEKAIACHRCLRPGGVAAFSVRDYAAIERKSPDVRPYGLRHEGGSRFLAVQVWEWDADQYDLRRCRWSSNTWSE